LPPLHSEASFAPAWPEIIWLLCVEPPVKDGETTLCDGIKLWQNLSSETKDFFQSSPIRYECEIPIAEKRPGKGTRPWNLKSHGASHGSINWATGSLHITQTRFAVQESRFANKLCFANHLFTPFGDDVFGAEPQLHSVTAGGKEIPKTILQEIRQKADELTCELIWHKKDLIMLDNKRFYHGRRAYSKDDPRDIVITQTSKASFGYGSTTRNRLGSPKVD